MTKNQKKSFLFTPHSKDCFVKDGKNIWSGLTDGFYWGNFAGNPLAKRGVHYIWHKVLCNDPKCPAIKAVHSSVLIDA